MFFYRSKVNIAFVARSHTFRNSFMYFLGFFFLRVPGNLPLIATFFFNYFFFHQNCWSQESVNGGVLKYPLALTVKGKDVYIADLELPGILKFDGKQISAFHIGSRRIRGELNRPRCIALHPKGGLLVGDSATNEIYHVKGGEGFSANRITNGMAGTPMCLALSSSGETIFFGDAESRSILKVATVGGTPELLSEFNARGLCFDDQDRLWALGTDKVCIVCMSTGKLLPVLESAPFEYPNSIFFWKGSVLITDGYKKAIWKVDATGACSIWFEGPPIRLPVGIIGSDEYGVLVADPRSKSIFSIFAATPTTNSRIKTAIGNH